MTNPNNAIGTNAAYGGRTSVNAFNDSLSAYNQGIMSGWACVPNTGMTVSVGGVSGTRDVAIAEDNIGNKTTVNNISFAPVNVSLAAAPVANSRIDLIVVYVDGSPQGSPTVADNPESCGIVAVKGTASATPSVPSDATIRAAITADGAAGSTAYYTVLAQITIENGDTEITSDMIVPGQRSELALISTDLSEPTSLAFVDTVNIVDKAVTAEKIDLGSIGLDYSTTEVNTGAKWIDGRAIYKKTVNTGTLPNDTEKTVPHGISNLGRVLKVEGYAYNGTNDATFPLPFVWTNALSCVGVLIGTTTINIRSGVDRTDYTESYITLYYTKSS